MPHESWQRHVVGGMQFADARGSVDQPFDHGPTSRVGHGGEKCVQLLCHRTDIFPIPVVRVNAHASSKRALFPCARRRIR